MKNSELLNDLVELIEENKALKATIKELIYKKETKSAKNGDFNSIS